MTTDSSHYRQRHIWLLINLTILLFYAVALGFALAYGSQHPVSVVALFLLILHLLEIPLAWLLLSDHRPVLLRVVIFTFIFGVTWWLPARQGIYKVR